MKKILVIIGTYLPGYKAGGPVLSIANLIDYLGDEYEFYVLTSCCDLNETVPYSDITVEDWNMVGKARVFYTACFSKDLIAHVARGMDVVYVCGCFNAYGRYALSLKRDGKIQGRLIVAAMGLFSDGAFRIKYAKKKFYMLLTNLLGLYRRIEWSASTKEEAANIAKHVWGQIHYHIAKDLPRRVRLRSVGKPDIGEELRVVFLSRISREKNLSYALNLLQDITDVKVHFSIVGVMEDDQYWQECQELICTLPSNVTCEYMGAIASNDVVRELEGHHVFLFPTLGENYGHVIQEALSAGCVALISDQTPWQDLENYGVGASIPLEEPQRFVDWLHCIALMDADSFQEMSDRAIRYAYEHSNLEEMAQKYREMFKQ